MINGNHRTISPGRGEAEDWFMTSLYQAACSPPSALSSGDGNVLLLLDDIDDWGNSGNSRMVATGTAEPFLMSAILHALKGVTLALNYAIDNISRINGCNSDGESSIIDGLSRRRVFVVATCTRLGDCPPECLLPHMWGRHGHIVTLSNPDECQRRQLIEKALLLMHIPLPASATTMSRDLASRWRSCTVPAIGMAIRDGLHARALRSTLYSRMRRVAWTGNTGIVKSGKANTEEEASASSTPLLYLLSQTAADPLSLLDAVADAEEVVMDLMRAEVGSSSLFGCNPLQGPAGRRDDSEGGGDELVNVAAQQDMLRRSVIWPLQENQLRRMADGHANERSARSIPCCTGILIHGSSGTGKTALCQWLVTQARLPFVSVSCADLVHKAVGESEQAIADIFKVARNIAPCFLLLDNIEMIVGMTMASQSGGAGTSNKRSSRMGHAALDRILSTLLAEIDGLSGKSGVVFGHQQSNEGGSSANVVVVATTSDVRLIERYYLTRT